MIDNQQSQRKLLTDYQRRQAFELHEAGMSYRQIARELGYKSDSTIRALFAPKKPKPVAPTLPAKKTKPKTPSVLIHRVITSSTSVPMMKRRRHYSPPLNCIPTRKNELLEMLSEAVRNTPRR